MPLLTFPGGYGGMVMGHGNRLSLSCCLRRDVLQLLRHTNDLDAGDVVERYLIECCRGAREVLSGAERLGPWLAAGPIRPGVRPLARHGIFRVGNAAGEAHPVVAEGISMALQGAWLLADTLLRQHMNLRACEADYARAWRHAFVPRLRTAALIARWAQSPALVSMSLPALRQWPHLLTWAARLAGKDRRLVPPSPSPLLAEAT
jgi:flavin-dependent dehydrogenase